SRRLQEVPGCQVMGETFQVRKVFMEVSRVARRQMLLMGRPRSIVSFGNIGFDCRADSVSRQRLSRHGSVLLISPRRLIPESPVCRDKLPSAVPSGYWINGQ